MTRDYKNAARPTPKRSTPSRATTSGGNVWKGMLLGLFIGVAVAVGMALYLNRNNNPFTAPKAPAESKPVAPQATPAAAPESLKPGAGTKQPPAPPVQSYDFYKILPGNEDPNVALPPKTDAPAPAADKAPPAAPPAWFQVGAFQNEADADNLKATLALKGIEASIQTTNLPEKGIWHRVRVGPLKSMAEVDKMRATLRSNGIEANLIQPKESKPAVTKTPVQ